MLIRSYFTVKKRDVPKDELEKFAPASMAESVKLELLCAAGIQTRGWPRETSLR